ncbi:hypothetical protein D3C87_1426620 [compost metagenome]
MLFASMVDGAAGSFPGDNSGFRYLIPDDDERNSYSKTVLSSRALIHRAAFGHAVLQLLDSSEFDYVVDENGVLAKMVAKRGDLEVQPGNYQSLEYEFDSSAFDLPASQGALPLTVEFAQIRWFNAGKVLSHCHFDIVA